MAAESEDQRVNNIGINEDFGYLIPSLSLTLNCERLQYFKLVFLTCEKAFIYLR